MMRHFVEFTGRPFGANKNEIRVTLNSRGSFFLNTRACEVLKNPSYVKFYFDEPRRLIGIRRVEGNHPNAFPIRNRKKMNIKTVNGAAFCTHFKIHVDHTSVFLNARMEGDMLTLDMTKTANVSRGAR